MAVNKIEDLSALWDEVEPYDGVVRLLVDHPEQLRHLAAFEEQRTKSRKWSIFLKLDAGVRGKILCIYRRHWLTPNSRRAGLVPGSGEFNALLELILISPAIELYGFYCHAGQSYGSRSFENASAFLSVEVEAVNEAAGLALTMRRKQGLESPPKPYVLAVGSTPTAHAATAETRAHITSILNGTLELHAGMGE